MSAPARRCAIYTRKSSDEGLEQSFNSLDAQREAGEAYVRSQAHEGWKLLPARYDDGGFSGGTMERPGLKRLLSDVESGLVDVVVVYKIDRLTRSLADFARIVEMFDSREVSFVSVTQAFNTTTSMGRLTLNVLLSFAQFEREVTGERIRDKIAASKARGMWMGGVPPLGYDIPAAGSRALRINEAEAAHVRHIFGRYQELGSVHALQRELAKQSIFSKSYLTQRGKLIGGAQFSRGALFHLLRNRTYLGQIVHKGAVHEGGHQAIVGSELFTAVQLSLDAKARRHAARPERRIAKAPLTGKLFDAAGEPMSPTFSRGKSGRAYRYYVSSSLQKGGTTSSLNVIRRLPAREVEHLLEQCAKRWLPGVTDPFAAIVEARLIERGMQITVRSERTGGLVPAIEDNEFVVRSTRKSTTVEVTLALPLRGGRRHIIAGDRSRARKDAVLIGALRKAHAMLRRDRSGLPILAEAPRSPYDRHLLRLAFLAPDIQRDIIAGHQPVGFNLETLRRIEIPLCWSEQRRALGWSNPPLPVSG